MPCEQSGVYALGELGIDYERRGVTVAEEPVELTSTEYAVLYQLTVQAPLLLTHRLLLQRVWGPRCPGEVLLL